jgi:RHS repeat-associated protein
LIDHYEPVILTAQDYYPFGMISRVALPNNGQTYRYGFNGKENDNGVKGLGNQQDYGMRIYDPRVGRFLSVDPLAKKYPWYTPYQYAGNKPVWKVDVDGMEEEDLDLERDEREELERERERQAEQARMRESLKSPTAEEEAKSKREFEEWSRKSPEERFKDNLRTFFQSARNGARNYNQNALAAAQTVFGGGVVNNANSQWQTHEENVYKDLVKNNPQGQFGKQITLDVYNKNGEVETIRGDVLFKPNAKSPVYELVDAKFSSTKDLTTANLKTTVTESQAKAYDWIKNGQVAAIIPRGPNAAAANLPVGQSINVSPQIKIVVNIPQTPQNLATYGSTGILYRTY